MGYPKNRAKGPPRPTRPGPEHPATRMAPPSTGPSAPRKGDRPLKTLERVLSKAGYGSRTEARGWIAAGRVTVNGTVVRDADAWVDLERDRVAFDGETVRRSAPFYLLFHKPTGYLTTYDDPQGRPTIFDLLPADLPYLFPVGRLDLDTSGLLILTNDTRFAEFLTNPVHAVPKTYRVRTADRLDASALERLRQGVELKDGPTRPAEVRHLRDVASHTWFELTLREGRNRQVRRMVEAVGSKVEKLVRVAIGHLEIGDLAVGSWRELRANEVASLWPGRAARGK